MLELPRPEPARRVRQLEWPEEVTRLLEVRPHDHDLVHQVFDADDAEFAQILLDDLVVGERDPLAVDLSVSPLVDEVADAFYALWQCVSRWVSMMLKFSSTLDSRTRCKVRLS